MERKQLLPRTLLAAFALLATSTYAAVDPYDMTFAGRGEATTVETVTVENLTQNTSLDLNGTDILRLTSQPTGIEDGARIEITEPILYPNPAQDRGTLVFDATASGQVLVSVADLSGRILNNASFNLEAGRYSISLPAMPTGIYAVAIRGAGTDHTFKWMCVGNGTGADIIALNGADGQPLPIVQTRAVESDAKVVEMLYKEGDLLRFTGTNGNMTTIVTNTPTCSHDITFDFYHCTDATGRHYPIVRAGGMLWMAEDLGYVGNIKVPLMTSAAMWKEYGTTNAKAAYYNYDASTAAEGVYYNYAGALAALPDGWKLPTAGEVDYMVQRLGGYEEAGNRIKAHGKTSLWPTQALDADTISFGAQPYGFLDKAGTFTSYSFMAYYITRSLSNGLPYQFSITNTNGSLDMTKKGSTPPSTGRGYHIRGCRTAPSAYDDMIKIFQAQEPAPTPTTKAIQTRSDEEMFGDGPLGKSYILSADYQKVFVDYSHYSSNAYISQHYEFDYASPTASTATQITITTKESERGYTLKKMAPQSNANGRQNMLTAIWSRPTNAIVTEGITGVGDGSLLTGYGNVKLTSFNSPKGDVTTHTLTLKDGLEFYMPDSKDIINSLSTNYVTMADAAIAVYARHEWYSRHFTLNTADIDQDGVDDIILQVGTTVAIYNGTNYALISSKTFDGNNMRVTVGDIDGDRIPDLAVIRTLNKEQATIEVFKSCDLTKSSFANANMPYGVMNDIKIGNATSNSISSIVCSTRDISSKKPFNIRVFEYDEQSAGKLKQASSTQQTVTDEAQIVMAGNNNITLARFRGSAFPQDIVVKNQCYRYDTDKKTLVNKGAIFNLSRQFIFADNIVAGNFCHNDEGREQLMMVRMWAGFGIASGSSIITSSLGAEIARVDLQSNNTSFTENAKVMSSLSGNTQENDICQTNYTGWGIPGMEDYWFPAWVNGISLSKVCFPSIAAVRFSEPGKVMKFVEHQTTMTEPRIYALLAAPPYFKYKPDGTEYEYAYDRGTSWGKSSLSGGSTGNSSSNAASVILGYEHEFNLPIVGTKVGSIDFETKLQMEWTNSTEQEEIITKTNNFTIIEDDGVVLTAYYYDSYIYEIIGSSNPDEIGGQLSISLPQQPRTMLITLTDYERLAGDNPEIPNLHRLFKHTVGKPFTYPSEKSEIFTNVAGTKILWGASVGGDEFIGAGSGGILERSISLDKQTTQTSAFSFKMEAQLVGTVFGVKAGAGYGYDDTNSTSHTEGEGHTIAGSVAGLRSLGEAGLPDFKWNVCWFQYRMDGQVFPVVYYVVKK